MKIDEHLYKLISLAINAIVAIGTVSAVLVSLWLSRRDTRHRLSVQGFTGQLISYNMTEYTVTFRVANTGFPKITLLQVGLRLGLFSPIEVQLNAADSIRRKNMKLEKALMKGRLRIYAKLSVGKIFTGKPSRSLMDIISAMRAGVPLSYRGFDSHPEIE